LCCEGEAAVRESAGAAAKQAIVACTHFVNKVLNDGLHGTFAPGIVLHELLRKKTKKKCERDVERLIKEVCAEPAQGLARHLTEEN